MHHIRFSSWIRTPTYKSAFSILEPFCHNLNWLEWKVASGEKEKEQDLWSKQRRKGALVSFQINSRASSKHFLNSILRQHYRRSHTGSKQDKIHFVPCLFKHLSITPDHLISESLSSLPADAAVFFYRLVTALKTKPIHFRHLCGREGCHFFTITWMTSNKLYFV